MKYFIYSVIGVVLFAVVAGFFVINSPSTERALQFDNRRVNDLQNAQYQIITYWQAKQKLPAMLTDMNDATRGVTIANDPETNQPYDYTVTGELSFNLCAKFSKASDGSNYALPMVAPRPLTSPYPVEDNWAHDPGKYCFERKIDPAFYKPLGK